jgi:phosphoribosylamine---glycine ligase
MNILVIGSGGREHAICDAFSRSPRVDKVLCANGNAGIAAVAECVDIRPDDVGGLLNLAKNRGIDLTFVGGETSLALGIVDAFEDAGLKIIGPTRSAARLESSKAYAKEFMTRHRIPTAAFAVYDSADDAEAALESGQFGDANSAAVVKADGLAAGKGVVVASNRDDAVAAIREVAEAAGGEAASRIVIEECLVGHEVSLLMFADGNDFVLMPPARDHKRIGEGDTGPNTGGMGTITDSSLLPHDEIEIISDLIIEPTLAGCIADGIPFRGVLFLGLMMTAHGPRLLEYNVRFGDPETQAILIRLESDLVDICEAMLAGNLSSASIEWKAGSSACVVLAAKDYPGKPRTGDAIHGVEDAAELRDVKVFHAGTGRDTAGSLVTSGGRVLAVTATGGDLTAALTRAYEAAGKIHFDGMQLRRDIGRTV